MVAQMNIPNSTPSAASTSLRARGSVPSQTSNSTRSQSSTQSEKRKSIVYMAAEAVQQERDTIRALKRLSMGGGGSLVIDPEMIPGLEHELETVSGVDQSTILRHQRKRSSSGSSLASETSFDDDDDDDDEEDEDGDIDDDYDDADITLVDQNRPIDNDDGEENEDIILDTEKLLWVPAKSHPSIAPERFKRHVQNTLDDINKKAGTKRKNSLPSLKDLTDELDKLSEMAGLEANDAITLARSLSSASSTSHLLVSRESSLLQGDLRRKQTIETDSSSSLSSTASDVDEDAPIFASTTLKRNKWNTYSRHRRANKQDKLARGSHSPLINETVPDPIPKDVPQRHLSLESKPLPQLQQAHRRPSLQEKPMRQQHRQDAHTRPSSSHQPAYSSKPRPDPIVTSFSHEHGPGNGSDIKGTGSARTNHSRNRHAGSIISLESSTSNSSSGTGNVVAPHKSNTGGPQPISKDPVNTGTFETKSQQRQQETSAVMLSPKSETPIKLASPPRKKNGPGSVISKKESKKKDLLNMFKRSISPKVRDKKEKLPNDENSPFIEETNSKIALTSVNINTTSIDTFNEFQNEYQQQTNTSPTEERHSQDPLPKRPSIRTTPNFKFSKQTQILQESVKSLPARTSRKKDANQIQSGDVYSSTARYETSPTSPTFDQSLMKTSPKRRPKQQHQQKQAQSPQKQPPVPSQATIEHQKQELQKKLSMESISSSANQKANPPVKFTDSPFGFPLPPLSKSTIIMLDYRFPVDMERAIYRMSHLKLANAKRPLRQQVLLSNFMYAYLNLVNHTLYLQQLEEGQQGCEAEEE